MGSQLCISLKNMHVAHAIRNVLALPLATAHSRACTTWSSCCSFPACLTTCGRRAIYLWYNLQSSWGGLHYERDVRFSIMKSAYYRIFTLVSSYSWGFPVTLESCLMNRFQEQIVWKKRGQIYLESTVWFSWWSCKLPLLFWIGFI